jgi:hypothetical protein
MIALLTNGETLPAFPKTHGSVCVPMDTHLNAPPIFYVWSLNLSKAIIYGKRDAKMRPFFGSPCWARTNDPAVSVDKQLLYFEVVDDIYVLRSSLSIK